MSEITIIPVEDIIHENFVLTGIPCDDKRAKAVAGCYSSYYYYESLQEQIASIVVSLIKGHFFLDGNKRTALSTYLVLSRINGLKHITDIQKQADVFVEIASTHKDMPDYVKLLFPE